MTKTTAVIPNYNGIKYIDRCLETLCGGTVVPQIIVVDNHSEDGSLALVKEKYKDVKVIAFQENTGFSKAVNAGIHAAVTEYVLLLNNDTEADGQMVFQLEKALDAHPGAFSAAAKMIDLHNPDKLDGTGDFFNALGWAFARGKDKGTERFERPGRVFSACAGAALYRRKLFDRIGLFDETHFAYLEDIDLGYRANIYGYSNIYVPEAKVFHAGSAVSGSRHNTFKVKLSARNNFYMIYKNMPFLQILLNLPFLAAGYLVKGAFFTLKGMGGAYFVGLSEGVRLVCSKEGRRNKVKFSIRNTGNYFWIQGQLWLNVLRRLFQF